MTTVWRECDDYDYDDKNDGERQGHHQALLGPSPAPDGPPSSPSASSSVCQHAYIRISPTGVLHQEHVVGPLWATLHADQRKKGVRLIALYPWVLVLGHTSHHPLQTTTDWIQYLSCVDRLNLYLYIRRTCTICWSAECMCCSSRDIGSEACTEIPMIVVTRASDLALLQNVSRVTNGRMNDWIPSSHLWTCPLDAQGGSRHNRRLSGILTGLRRSSMLSRSI